jgi:hypothetical protein
MHPLLAALARRVALPVVLGLAAGAASAQSRGPAFEPVAPVRASGDPLQSAPCRQALDQLQAQEAAAPMGASPGGSAAGADRAHVAAPLQAARRRAAAACLASRADPPRPQRLAEPPIAVSRVGLPPLADEPPGALRAPSRSPAPIALPGAPMRPPERPLTVLGCDAGGCWANDGSRLNRVGPMLSGPQGICTLQGSQLLCP